MGTYGMALLRTSGSRAGLWQLEGMGPLVIDFPLRASRPLNGKPSLSCGRTANVSPPCRPDQAGANLQVGYNVTGARDTWLAPNVGLQVHGTAAAQTPAAAPPNNTTPPSATRGPTATTPPRQTSGTTPAKLSLAAPRRAPCGCVRRCAGFPSRSRYPRTRWSARSSGPHAFEA